MTKEKEVKPLEIGTVKVWLRGLTPLVVPRVVWCGKSMFIDCGRAGVYFGGIDLTHTE